MRHQSIFWLLILVISSSLLISFPVLSNQQKIIHDPIANTQTGKRLQINTQIQDPQGVSLVRAYFKHETGNNYMFVNLMSQNGKFYSGELPASSIANSQMQYLLLVKNDANQVYKSQEFNVQINAGSALAMQQPLLQVYTELNHAPKEITGFTDSLTIDIAESSVKYGVVAQLYGSSNTSTITAMTGASNSGTVAVTTTTSAASSSAAAAAVSTSSTTAAGVTAAAATGISTTAIVAGVAVVGGVAAAAASSSDDDEPEPEPEPEEPIDYSGVYTVNLDGSLNNNIAGDCFSGAQLRFTNVNLAISGTTITLDFNTGTMTGSITENNVSITSGTLAIEPGTPGFSSTDEISWPNFSAQFSNENSLSSSSFQLNSFETGVEECGYQATLTGTK